MSINTSIYLYVKQHSITGLKYFGMTRKKNPFKYNGSGSYWLKHIRKHGSKFIKTLDIFGFDTQELCTEFAIKFSNDNNIVECKGWANLCLEEGKPNPKLTPNSLKKLSASKKGFKHTEKAKQKMSSSAMGRIPPNKGIPMSEEQKNILSKSCKGKKVSDETRRKMSEAKKGIKFSEEHKQSMRNRVVSDIVKDKIRKSLLGKKHSEERRRNISNGAKGRVPWNKGNVNGIKVINL